MSVPFAEAAAAARLLDSQVRRKAVKDALARMIRNNEVVNASSLARRAQVSRSFIYRHEDLRAQMDECKVRSLTELSKERVGAVTSASLRAELLHERSESLKLRKHIRTLERRISELSGERVMVEAGLPGNEDGGLEARVHELMVENRIIRQQLDERADDLAAARRSRRGR